MISIKFAVCRDLYRLRRNVASQRQDVVLQQKLMQAFAVFDKDGSGFISVNEDSDFRKQMTRIWLAWGKKHRLQGSQIVCLCANSQSLQLHDVWQDIRE